MEFRGVDLRSSRLPDGPEYLRVDDFRAKARRVRSVLAGWSDVEREKAQWLLRLYGERWCEPLFRWRKALATPRSCGRCSNRYPRPRSVLLNERQQNDVTVTQPTTKVHADRSAPGQPSNRSAPSGPA